MKKRSKVLAVLLCASMAFTAGCGGKADSKDEGAGTEAKEETSESDEYLSWIEAAWEQYQAEEVHGYTAEWTNTRADGSTDQSKFSRTVDTANKQAVTIASYLEQEGDATYFVVEDGNDYMYTTGYAEDGSRPYYKVALAGQEDTTRYADFEDEIGPFESNDYRKVSNITVSKEGEEELDGTSVIKLKAEYEIQMTAGEEISRESVMADWEWTEEDVALLDGLSDVLDSYVEETNAQEAKNAEPYAYTHIVYLTNDEEHKLVRTEESQEYTEEQQQASITPAVVNEFYDLSNKLNYLKFLLNDGVGKDEAMGLVNEAYSTDMGTEEESPIASGSGWTNYLTGDACEPVGELPAGAEELTWDQWYNGEY